MSAQHTPGPWTLSERMTVWSESDRLIACCCADSLNAPTASETASARLIAAAPDLLAALERIRDFVSEQPGANALAITVIASAAIAIAEGK